MLFCLDFYFRHVCILLIYIMCTTFGFSFIIEVKKTAFYVKIKGFVCKVYKNRQKDVRMGCWKTRVGLCCRTFDSNRERYCYILLSRG